MSGKNSSKTCFLLQNTRRKKANQGSPTISRVPPRGLISSCFLAKTHQTRVFCSKIREERRPIRAHLPFSLSPQEALFIRGFWLKRSKNVFFAPKYAKKEGQSGLPYHFPCPHQEAKFIRGAWLKGTENVFYAQLQRVCRDLGGAPDLKSSDALLAHFGILTPSYNGKLWQAR